jgi:hypothetical protein
MRNYKKQKHAEARGTGFRIQALDSGLLLPVTGEAELMALKTSGPNIILYFLTPCAMWISCLVFGFPHSELGFLTPEH